MLYQCRLKSRHKSKTNWNLVLDVDETLLHTFDSVRDLHALDLFNPENMAAYPLRKEIYHIQLGKGDGGFDEYWGIWRPHLKDFLTFATDFFSNVIIWSAGTTDYVHEIIRRMFRDHNSPSVILTRPDCLQEKGYIEKPILKISDICELYKDINLTNTLIIDDRDTAYSTSNPHNGIMIPAYEPEATIKGMYQQDHCLKQLQHWYELMHLKTPGGDVRSLEKSKIFDYPHQHYQKEIQLYKRHNRKN